MHVVAILVMVTYNGLPGYYSVINLLLFAIFKVAMDDADDLHRCMA